MSEQADSETRHVIHSLYGDVGFTNSCKQLLERVAEPRPREVEMVIGYMELRALWAQEMAFRLRGAIDGAEQLFEERQALARKWRIEREQES